MIYPLSQIASYLSDFMRLALGGSITMGAPTGVGIGQKPAPRHLEAGHVATLSIEKLGQQPQGLVAWESIA